MIQHNGDGLAQLNSCKDGENLLKVWIVAHIARRMDEKEFSQTKAAEFIGLKQPNLSVVLNGKFNGFSTEHLACCMSALGGDVKLMVKGPSGSQDVFVLKATNPC